VDDDAAVINIGMLLLGQGKAWIDAASFTDLGKVITRADPPRALTERGLVNLIAFTRLLGYVRHFHPSDEAAATKWDKFAVQGVLAVESAKDASELARSLEKVFRPIAPTVRVFPTATRARIPDELAPPSNDGLLKVVSWKHKGFGPGKTQNSTYHSERVRADAPNGKLPEGSADPRKPFAADLGGGISCLVPLALFADAKGTLPHAASSPAPTPDPLMKYSGNDRATRLADVALAWNVLQHFYPYFDVVQTDWPRALRDALTSAATDANEQAFLTTLRRMIAQLHDGHGNVFSSGQNIYSAPVIFGWIEDRLVITAVAGEGASGLQPGDIIVRVNGKPSLETLTESESLISGATPQWRRYRSVSSLAYGAKDSELTLEVKNESGEVRSVVLRRTVEPQNVTETRPPKISEIKPGIFYLALDRIKDEDFQAALPQLENAKGIIFDLRGYPSVSPMILSHLTDKPITSARWMVPIIIKPDHANVVEYDTGGRWDLQPIAPKLKAKIAFLTDGRAISYAESYMGIIEAYKLAEIVGEPTAGTNGNVNPFKLPGDYTVVWTGMKVLKHDGSQHHGIGIQPTAPVSRTIRGLREKRDEQLERAIAIVSQ
jgi:C-terminal processing protease CtpA/Prc